MSCPYDEDNMTYHRIGDIEFYVCHKCGKIILVIEKEIV